eukprot:scaffold3981_cov64-Cylindrotheca_fusiformis.AAC.1
MLTRSKTRTVGRIKGQPYEVTIAFHPGVFRRNVYHMQDLHCWYNERPTFRREICVLEVIGIVYLDIASGSATQHNAFSGAVLPLPGL